MAHLALTGNGIWQLIFSFWKLRVISKETTADNCCLPGRDWHDVRLVLRDMVHEHLMNKENESRQGDGDCAPNLKLVLFLFRAI